MVDFLSNFCKKAYWVPLLGLVTALLKISLFPTVDFGEAVFIFLVPLTLWLCFAPPWRLVLWVGGGTSFLTWLVLLVWLRHVTWPGWMVVSIVTGLFFLAWILLARWLLPGLRERRVGGRILLLLALAGGWMILEWSRTFVLTGFPWLPLSSALWERPLLLQPAAWIGAHGVSFILVFFNLGVTAYLFRLWTRYREGWRRLAPEFYLAVLLLLTSGFGVYRFIQPQTQEWEPLFRAGFVQPYIPQDEKWDEALFQQNLNILREQTLLVNLLEPDLLLWPEAVLQVPFPITSENRDDGSSRMGDFVDQLVQEGGTPIVGGAVGLENARGEREEQIWRNSVFFQNFGEGERQWYNKRKLVPFGEYIPLSWLWPWMDKFVPIGDGFIPGTTAEPLTFVLGEKEIPFGILICYEDIFPRLARRSTQAGAEILFVATNNAWYGEEAGAYQHAAHSVLRAVENRRPVLRVGNGGWSGWIDEFGNQRMVVTNEKGTVYFRGGTVETIERAVYWEERESLYTRWGEWFLLVALLFVIGGVILQVFVNPLTVEKRQD
ncbi:MAG: apolipoprotein N-acyltransferase [Opitutales bacterium]|nr:apolipoprotein N-acyltransferase [Opitutales bacterium]MCH8540822.1 apolipoprotein N-acyltransferase [Opitutales bacterium]